MTIEQDITDWALGRPAWQQQVLVGLADGTGFAAEQLEELADRVVAGADQEPGHEAKEIAASPSTAERVQLSALADLRGVNGLAPSQRLEFGEAGLTIVYGDNGSGKSGYARVIKTSVNARHVGQVLPDVFTSGAAAPSGALQFTVAGAARTYDITAAAVPELRRVAFYDEHCGDEYLSKQSTITYRPSALTLLDGLITVCDQVRAVLQARLRDTDGLALSLKLPASTTAGAFLASLSPSTTNMEIEEATRPRPGAVERLAEVVQEHARVSSGNPGLERTKLTTEAGAVETLAEDLARLVLVLGPDHHARRAEQRAVAAQARQAANLAASRSFDEPLPGVGSHTWRRLWEAARAFSVDGPYPQDRFPHVEEGAACVLCHQRLDEVAADRLTRFDQYMTDTTEQQAAQAETTLARSVTELQSLVFLTPGRAAELAALRVSDFELSDSATSMLTTLEETREVQLAWLASPNGDPPAVPELDSELPCRVRAIASELRTRAEHLDLDTYQQVLNDLATERDEIEAYARVEGLTAELHREVQRLRTRSSLQGAVKLTDTAPITAKATALTKRYASAQILDHFTRETDRLGLLRVTLEDLGGQKGQLNQKPALLGAVPSATVPSVLSEGEQTALGLAGFFTEAEFDQSHSALVLDDPVTSLDHGRRDRVARRIIELASIRQVIVFTHDVVFTGDLCRHAEQAGVVVAERCIERRGLTTPGMCGTALPWKAKDFSARVQKLEVDLGHLVRDRAELGQADYEQRVADWAGLLSETWERCLTSEIFNQVFDRGSSEVRMMKFRLLVHVDDHDNQQLQDGYGAASRWARRHDKAAETNYVAPEPDELKQELDRIKQWQQRVKKYRS